MNVTVIVCTRNRARALEILLRSLAAMAIPESIGWEVLVVDNNSDDRTRQVAEEFCLLYPDRFRYTCEPHPGKSYALNAGVREARGDVLAFVDDDVAVEPTWLEHLTAGLDSDEWAGAGGRTLPAHPFSPPGWFLAEGPHKLTGILFAHFDLGDQPCELDQAPFGANMAFRKKMFERYGGFRTDLGPSPSREIPRPNEDTEFGRRLMAAGERLLYQPSATVYHPILQDRLEKKYFLDWHFDYGRAVIREAGRRPAVWGIPRHYLGIPNLLTSVPGFMWRWLATMNPQMRFYNKCCMWTIAGEIYERYRQLRWGVNYADSHRVPTF